MSTGYWRRALHEFEDLPGLSGGYGHEGDAGEPPKFKSYRGAQRYPLPPPPEHLDSPEWDLSAFLHYGAGLVRHELGKMAPWPYHRTVPSARCFAPTELYCWIPGTGDVPAGLYHYDAAHHALVLLRSGGPDQLGVACGADFSGMSCVVVLTSLFQRTAFRYGDYAYRLCSQEAGMVAGNLALVGASLGVTARTHYQFHDDEVATLLDLKWPDESAMAVLAFPGSERNTEPLGPFQATETHLSGVDKSICCPLIELETAARQVTVDYPPQDISAPVLPNLAHAMRARHSGGPMFLPVRRPVPQSTVASIVNVESPISCHVADDSVRPYLLATNVNYDHASFVVLLAGDRAAAEQALGARAFRVLNQQAGAVAQQICVRSVTHGLAARVHNLYDAAGARTALGLPDGWEVLFQIIVGFAGPSQRLQFPLPHVEGVA